MEILNDEQILELCIMAISQDEELKHSYPGEFLVYYVIKSPGGENLSCEEVATKVNELLANSILSSLVNKGYLDVDFDEDGDAVYRPSLDFDEWEDLELPEP